MTVTISSIWQAPLPTSIIKQLHAILEKAVTCEPPLKIFFRADDIAYVDEPFRKMMQTFLAHRTPLCLAVVPDWLNDDHWTAMQEFDPGNPLWCWHQHGRRHINHQKEGKKCEFGEARTKEEIRDDLVAGRQILTRLLDDLLYPVFTPPWNRCSLATLEILAEMNFSAVSRSVGAKPPAHTILPDFAVNVDLHTRKENDFDAGWHNLLAEFSRSVECGTMGVMLHHDRMNEEAFRFLDLLLSSVMTKSAISCVTFRELKS